MFRVRALCTRVVPSDRRVTRREGTTNLSVTAQWPRRYKPGLLGASGWGLR